jgi:hypothetical protein
MAEGDNRDIVTRPDPTERVNQSINEAIEGLRLLFEAKLEKNHEVDIERFRSLELQQKNSRDMSDERVEMILDRLKANTEMITDKIKDHRETAKAAVEAAFAAAGTAQDKQEKSFIKLLDTLGATVNDLKDRIVVMEGKASVADPSISTAVRENAINITALKEFRDLSSGRSQQHETSTGTWIAIIAAVAAMALVLVDAAGLIRPH